MAAFIASGKPRSLQAGEIFCRLGDGKHELAFLHQGIVRYFVTLADGAESTKDFSFAPGFTVSIGSAVTGSRSCCRMPRTAIAPCWRCFRRRWPMCRGTTSLPVSASGRNRFRGCAGGSAMNLGE